MTHLRKFNEEIDHMSDDDIVQYYIENDEVNIDNGSPLRMMVSKGRFDLARLLVDNGADVSIRRNMIIKWATEWGRIDALRFLLPLVDKNLVTDVFLSDMIHWLLTSDKIKGVRKDSIMRVYQRCFPSKKDFLQKKYNDYKETHPNFYD